MTQEEKQLLIKDLCARLPYGVKMQFSEKFPEWFAKKHGEGTTVTPFTLDVSSIGFVMININNDVNDVKPYLRPMSSMTEEEKEELKLEHVKDTRLLADALTKTAEGDTSMRGKVILHFAVDWCNKNHFDFRGLIEKELALEAPEDMYKIK